MFEEFQEAARLKEEKKKSKECEPIIKEVNISLPWLSKLIKGKVEKFMTRN